MKSLKSYNILEIIKDNLIQISAIVEKSVKLKLRVKSHIVLTFISPIIGIIMPLIIMGQIFSFAETGFGPWNSSNFFIYQLIAYQLSNIFGVMHDYPGRLRQEKFWKTLPALLIAPFNRINLLIGIFLSHLVIISVPFSMFFIIGIIYMPISIFTIISMLMVYFCVALIFAGIGLILGIGAISKENMVPFLNFVVSLGFSFSAITLPFEFFPDYIQFVINLNPLYYIIDFARLVWIENNIIFTIITHPFRFIILIGSAILAPIIGLIIFNYIFKKYGIQGY